MLIVDDHADFRRSATALLEASGFDVVGEAPDGPTALTEIVRLNPDAVLLDIALPGQSGIELAEQLAGIADRPAVVLVSSRDASSYGERLRRAPGRGFLAKSDLSGETFAALLH